MQEPKTKIPRTKTSDSINWFPQLGLGPCLNTDPRVGTKIRPKVFHHLGFWFRDPVLIDTIRVN